jgi:hypothetical protein
MNLNQDMRNILAGFNKLSEKKNLNESALTECPPEMESDMGGGAGTVDVNFSGEPSAIAALMKALSSIEAGGAGPSVAMSKPLAIGGPPEGPDMGGMDDPEIPGRDDVDGDDDVQAGMIGKVAGAGLGAMAGGPVGAAAGAAAGDALTGEEDNEPAMDISKMSDEQIAEWENEPDEQRKDHNYMTKELSGGLNREKKMYKKAQDGDNAMAVESIKSRLMKALEEAKDKPDFLDVDKDKDKKEPMKKALKDKAKGKVDELSPGTLKSYAKKASSSTHPNSSSNLSSRAAFDLGQDDDGKDSGAKDDQKSVKRSEYVGKAIDKMTAAPKKK